MATIMLDAAKMQFELTFDGHSSVVYGFLKPVPTEAWPRFEAVLYTPTATELLPIELARTIRVPGPCEITGYGWMHDVDPATAQTDGTRHLFYFKDGRQLALRIQLFCRVPAPDNEPENGGGPQDDDEPDMPDFDSDDEMDEDDRAQCWD